MMGVLIISVTKIANIAGIKESDLLSNVSFRKRKQAKIDLDRLSRRTEVEREQINTLSLVHVASFITIL